MTRDLVIGLDIGTTSTIGLVLRPPEGTDRRSLPPEELLALFIERAEAEGRILMVGHLLQYHPVFRRLVELVQAGELGQLRYMAGHRMNLGAFRYQESALWCLSSHDISMMLALTGGTESMSKAPHVVRGARWGLRLGPGADFEDMLWEALTDSYCGFSMAETAENLAEEYDIDRQAADEYAVRSQQLAKEAWDEGRFDEEVIPLTVEERGGERTFHEDEHMRPDTTVEALADLKPYFKEDGLVTAGNASGIGDGAAAVVVASREWAESRGLKPLARLVSWGVAGVDPEIMGIGPVPAIRTRSPPTIVSR